MGAVRCLSGGRSGGAELANNLAMDVAYFQTVHHLNGENTYFTGIPTKKDEDKYSANITYFAFSPDNTDKPDEAYDLIRYLMDYEYKASYGFSVNKRITEKQILDLQNGVVYVDGEGWASVESGINDKSEVQKNRFKLNPLSEEYVYEIKYMLDNLEGAGVPANIIEYKLMNGALLRIGDSDGSIQDIVGWTEKVLDKYMSDILITKPYTDISYDKKLFQ